MLGLVIAEALLAEDPAAQEGELAPRLNALVRKETCAEVAASLDLGAALRMGRSEMLTGGRRKTALLGDAMEAVIAAVYLDGGLEAARRLILRVMGRADRRGARGRARRQDQRCRNGRRRAACRRRPTSTSTAQGPDHAPVFSVEARLEDGRAAEGRAASKRAAQQAAAEALLARVEGEA